MFEAKNISVRYGKHLALDNVSLSVGEGECVVILGANGAGKSSLLRGITALSPRAPGGSVHYCGQDISDVPAFGIVELGIAHVPEGRGVFTKMSVEDNLRLGGNPVRARGSLNERRDEVLEMFPKLAERRRQIVGTMSGGEQQMVAIARALMSQPDLLLLDEPSLGLAPIVVGEMFETLKRVRDTGMSILIVEQNVHASLNLAARGYVIEAGRIVGEGDANTLMNDPVISEAFLGH
ncbi:ABC transporter ATP-binding protein [Thalassospira lucentensis]|uniref:ABC transporter ATP-binding protein n=1 Tax=Thalassospira lucentensis TaxID=168935 RepID=UPI0003B463AD|nr:ABC transporter ATP-binding protein [Thalassospira lucentensis]RCK21756.1 ABC transporter ATP-binding protein [Thalassospira lucentensis MCCC 1A00383 = DSM 14000]